MNQQCVYKYVSIQMSLRWHKELISI